MGDSKDFLENLFSSVDVIIQSRIKDLGYDKTELCTIEEVKGNKEYYVSNGSAKFIAYAQGSNTYTKGSSVYVTVPQGNYNNQKIIIGNYNEGGAELLNWVSPMENFVNITGNISTNAIKGGLSANQNPGSKYPYAQLIWEDDTKNSYTGYDRICISADFTNNLMTSKKVIDGNYGLILVGEYDEDLIEDAFSGEDGAIISEALDEYAKNFIKIHINEEKFEKLSKDKKETYNGIINKILFDFKNSVISIYNNSNRNAVERKISKASLEEETLKARIRIIEVNRDIEKELISENNPLRDELIKEIEDDCKVKKVLIKGEIYSLRSLICIFSSNDMMGNPYNYSSPFNQQKLFSIKETNKIKNLKLYFYRDLDLIDGKFEKTFITMTNELLEPETANNIFVENVNIGFGYSFEQYSEETAVLFTLDPKEFSNTENSANTVTRTMRIRWVHFEDEQPYSITDINNSLLNGHYVKVHWYRYLLEGGKDINDPLAGYFWKEIDEAKNLFEYTATLNQNWVEENFKVIIEYNGTYIESEILEFKNPGGSIKDGNNLLGLKINFTDNHQGKFYCYNELDGKSSLADNLPFTLLAEYDQVASMTGQQWETNDIICWKIPAINSMITRPIDAETENNADGEKVIKTAGEYVSDFGDIFIEAGTGNTKTMVGGIAFKPNKDYHQIIRKVIAVNEDETDITKIEEAKETRKQIYRFGNFYNALATNNTIKCAVYKPQDPKSPAEAEVSLSFGYSKTNGTKYTLVVDWEETCDCKNLENAKKYTNPGAITWIRNHVPETEDGTTKYIDFKVTILNSGEDTGPVTEPDGGWKINLSWYCNDCYSTEKKTKNLADCFKLENNRLTVNFQPDDDNLYTYAKYQILKVTVTNFDYALTKYIPIPIRTSRSILGIDGASSIIYDATGHNPFLNEKGYVVRYTADEKSDETKNSENIWKISYAKTKVDTKTSKTRQLKEDGKYSEFKTWGNSMLPQLEREYIFPNAEVTEGETHLSVGKYYIISPSMFLKDPDIKDRMEGISVYAQNKNGLMLWVQPIMVMCDPYGSQFLNNWDGSMLIDQTNNLIMTSMIGAGTKSKDNKFTGVIMGDLNKIEDSGENAFVDSGILGFKGGVQGFSLSTTGVATLGRPSTGQITLNGDQGYIISGGFNGFNGGKILKDDQQPPRDENGNEKFNFGTLKLNERKGVYIGMDTGNVCFAGTLYSSKGNIGGWELDTGKLSSGTTYLYSQDQANESTIILSDKEKQTLKTWRIKVGNKFGVDKDGNLYAESITTLGSGLNAVKASIEELETKLLKADQAIINDLKANYVTTDKLDAVTANITKLQAADVTISDNLNAAIGRIGKIEANYITTDILKATTINGSQINATSYVTCQGLKVNGTSYTMNTEWVSYIEGESIPVVIGVDFDNKKPIWGSVWQIKTHTKKQLKFLGTKMN